MLQRLSARCQKEIALSFIALFFISGLNSLRAEFYNASGDFGYKYYNTGNGNSSLLPASKIGPVMVNPINVLSGDEKDNKKVQSPLKETNSEKGLSLTTGNGQYDEPFIGGPTQPEMNAFQSVGSNNMVSSFTGDFSYNIPLLDVGGYPVNMFYSSGIAMDQEASWVGLGWNINPGTITRNMRGLPDDFDGSDKIIKTQSFREDKTFGLTTGASIKLAGFPILRAGVSWGLAWNNKLGISAEAGLNAALTLSKKSGDTKTASLSASVGLNGSSRSGGSISPSISFSASKSKAENGEAKGYSANIGTGFTYSSRRGLSDMHLNYSVSKTKTIYKPSYKNGKEDYSSDMYSASSTLSFAYPSVLPSITKPFTRRNYSVDFSMGFELYGLQPHLKLHGYFSNMYIADEDKRTEHPAYGMLNLEAAKNNKDALLDFNRANDGVYTPSSPTIAMPVYTYDVFSINGEGTGGSFRAYRGDVGYMRDPVVKTKENAFGLGVDLGFANTVHVGADLNYIYTPTESGEWKINNQARTALAFSNSLDTFQAAYFKNPGEKTVPDVAFQSAVADEDLVRLNMINGGSGKPLLMPTLVRYDANKNVLGVKQITAAGAKKMNRDKRTQVISFLTAEESERIGMSTKIYSYNAQGTNENHVIYSANCNKAGIDSFYRNHDADHYVPGPPMQPGILGNETDPFRHKNHISQIDVLSTDGKKHVYGLPVYNKIQKSVTFNIDQSQKKSDSKAVYAPEDATGENEKGRDWFMEKEEIPAYTHSYLLTELTSPNYVDVTGNGITEDDMGDAVKFNYSKYDDYQWRTPVGAATASYSSGLKTDEKDDKAHYIYGVRESWYLYSVESKNMVARFYVKSDRQDGRAVSDEMGALDMDPNKGMKRLDKISLFSKGDLAKFGDAAKPIKTIRFFQSYKLCKNVPGANDLGANIEPGYGKLTLDSIWITYNGNQRKPKSRYVFYYPDNTNNPNYNFDQSDRWGSYKPKADNPNALSNEDFPYSIQDQAKADKNVAAWTMNKILLPSGGLINIDYESDTYGYVQNKTAASMCQVIGFGAGTTLPVPGDLNKLYTSGGENEYVYVQLPTPINTTVNQTAQRNEFADRYLKDVKQLYIKLAVKMPFGSGLSGIAGNETIPVYADIADYGLISANVAWIKVRKLDGGGSTPMVQGALQFLTQQLPGKAYKGYDLSEEGGMKSVIMAMGGMLTSIGTMFQGETNKLKADLKCQESVLEKTFAKLSNPVRNKFGGGLRVKRITISDNWNKMTNRAPANSPSNGMLKATYGQEYKYTTTELINGKLETISSGVASWEPSIGSDENPFKEIMRHLDHNRGGPYDYGAVEMPLGEMFYPAAMVGYSRVEVLSIHRDTVKNQPTRQVTEFYTNKDFPYKSSFTDLKGDANIQYEPSKIMQLLRIDMMKSVTQSQGFLVETNDMNGKEKSSATYTVTDPVNPVSYTQNYYNTKQATDKTFSFNHNFPTIGAADGIVANKIIGRDIELMTDFREHHSETYTANLSINLDAFIVGFFPIPLFNLLQPVVREGMMYRSAGLLKVVTHYGMLDSVVVVDKGSMVSTKNLLYDAETGNPLLTRTQNEHNKPVYNFNYPAHWAYSGMGPAYKNIDAIYQNLNFGHGILVNPPADLFEKVLESGDELYVVTTRMDSLLGTPPCDDPANYNNSTFPWETLAKSKGANGKDINRIWAVNTAKAGATNGQWVFMDANGYPYNAVGVTMRIVRSGKRNMLDQSVAAITSLNYPVVNNQLVFNESTSIIQTASATFKDNWRVDNSFYQVRETVDSMVQARVHRNDYDPIEDITVSWYHHWTPFGGGEEFENIKGIENISNYLLSYKGTREYRPRRKHTRYVDDRKNSFLLYSYADLPANAIVYKALLSLYAHSNFPLFPNSGTFPYPTASHSGIHSVAGSQNDNRLFGEVNALNKDWYNVNPTPSSNANPWIDNYFNSNPSNVSIGKGVIPFANNGWDNYISGNPDTRINVTLPLLTNAGYPLFNQKKLGLKVRLASDEQYPSTRPDYSIQYRCFWSKDAKRYDGKANIPFAVPKLSYYYYKWGDVSYDYNPACAGDPSCNLMLTKFITSITSVYCSSKFTRKAMNPYVEGVLGNWRVDSTYAYYGERMETDPNVQVDTRTGGAIKAYKTFWNFPAPSSNPVYLTRNQQASDVWVWNSTITQYNRKGYEIENTDPLGRFNSGLYGYNQQLPVAVANNARVREVLFDGFEDYDYQTSANCIDCLPSRAFNYTAPVISKIDTTQRHTGRYSLKVDPGQSITINAPVTSVADADRAYGYKLKNSTISYTNQALGTNGTAGSGLEAKWYNHAVINNENRPALEPAASSTYPQAALIYTQQNTSPGIIYNSSGSSPVPGVSPTYFSVKWEGKLQAPMSGTYRFRTNGDNGFRIKVNGVQRTSPNYWDGRAAGGYPDGGGLEMNSAEFTLVVGQVYSIEISYYNQWNAYSLDIKWQYKPTGAAQYSMPYTAIPLTHLYGPAATSFQQVVTSEQTCYRLDSSQVTGNALTDTFSLLQNKKMLLSAWVKVGTANCCFPATYSDNGISANRTNSIYINYNGGGSTTVLQPSGSIIEGWQRYESVFDVPANATGITVSLNNNTNSGTSAPVFFDDIRIQPYNANMKSFVYHSSNLRLMAELDENNYASFYEYDDDGTLTRVKKETVRGIKTITETRSAMQKKIIND